MDTVSGPGVVWQVYHSRDNLIWEVVPGATSMFDAALLRYRTPVPRDRGPLLQGRERLHQPRAGGPGDRDPGPPRPRRRGRCRRPQTAISTAPTSRRPSSPADRVSGAVGVGLQQRRHLRRRARAPGLQRAPRLCPPLVRRRPGSRPAPGLPLERLREPPPAGPPAHREQLSATLNWGPLPTVDAILTARPPRRVGEGHPAPVPVLHPPRASLTQLLTDLRLVSDFDVSRLEDPFAGRDRNTWTWRETLEMRPFPRWSVGGGFTYALNETREGEPLLKRTQYRLLTHLERHHLPHPGRDLVVHQRHRAGLAQPEPLPVLRARAEAGDLGHLPGLRRLLRTLHRHRQPGRNLPAFHTVHSIC